MFYLFGFIFIYAAIGLVIWITEDIRFTAGWREFLGWPVVVFMWCDEFSEWIKEVMKEKFGDG